MSIIDEMFGKILPSVKGITFWDIISWGAFLFGIVIMFVGFYFWYSFKESIRANITIIDDKSGTRRIRKEKILQKKYPSGNKYYITHKSRIVIPQFPREFIFAGRTKLDEWVGYLDTNGFIHAVNFLNKKTYFKKDDKSGTLKVKEDPLFITIPQDLANFYLKSTEERVEKNKVLSMWEKLQPAMIMTSCVFGAIIIIVVMALGK